MAHRNRVFILGVFWLCVGLPPTVLTREARAEIPCVIDVLEGTDPNHFTQPGSAVDIDGDRIVAGSPSEGNSARGAVYIYVRDGIRWALEAKFVEASPPDLWSFLGKAVAISGDRAIAGAPGFDPLGDNFGRVWVYHKIGGQWDEEALLTPSEPAPRDQFGISVAIEGDVIVVGSVYAEEPTRPGRAFVFRRNGTQWTEEAALFAPGAVDIDFFGNSVSISGNRIAVGALWDDMGDGAKGSVYVFGYNGASWVQEARVRPNDDDTLRGFGISVALRGDRLVVGASGDQTFSISNGAAYVFDWNGASWEQQAKLFPSNPVGDVRLGQFLDVGSDAIVATSGSPPTHPYTAHVFVRDGANWVRRFLFEIGGDPALSDDGSLLVFGNHVYGLGAFPPCVPVTSSWGVLVMALGVATVGSVLLRRGLKYHCVCVCVAVFGSAGLGGPAFGQVAGLEHPHHPERLIVRYKPEASQPTRAAVPSRHGVTLERNDPYVDGLTFVMVSPGDLASKLVALRNDPDVLYAEPDYEITAASTPNDTEYGLQWGPLAVRAPEAWDSWTGVDAPGFQVAVIDSGIAYDHPDLVDNIWTNPGEIPGDAIDNDGNGYVDDVHGYDFGGSLPDRINDSNPYPEPGGGHGTHVAGVLAARANNALGVAGMAWRCKIVALKFFYSGTVGAVSDANEAIDYCIANGIRVSNNSYQFSAYSQAMYDKINAAKTAGHLFIGAVGNKRLNVDNTPRYPACYNLSNIIAVAGSDQNNSLWVESATDGSNFGRGCTDIAAPGNDIRSTYWDTSLGNIYVYGDGTSAAAPLVTGTAVLMMGKNPSWAYDLVRRRILDTAKFVPALDCKVANARLLDAAAALGDCNSNAVLDATDIANQTSTDCNNNGMPDECDYDCDGNNIPDSCESSLIRPCCFDDSLCTPCLNLTPCECVARGGSSGPAGETCHMFNCFIGPD